ncbi:Alanyl-tRNA editing protein Aarsd1 [Blyttiomyces sp. JEL0837]|nr:Alanyl-tRNA editing protein Aarsd1 [Blyttiomyces sp. JEL0837]
MTSDNNTTTSTTANSSTLPRASAKVGELACQKDSFLKTLTATIISCTPSTATHSSAASSIYEVILTDTILFPTGGGQPHDIGTIADFPVIECIRKGFECVHLVSIPNSTRLKVGQEVDIVLDWTRRWDHMQQHSGQHLLSAIAEQEFGLVTVGWGFGREKCFVEFDGSNAGKELGGGVIEAIERRVNEVIRGGVKVEVEVLENGEVHEKMPEDLVEGVVRVVKMGEVDRNPCCGTHVSSTADLQCVKLLHTEKVRGKNIRLFFIFGDRVFKTFQESLERDRAITSLLSTGPETFVEKITGLTKQLKDLLRSNRNNLKEIATLTALKLTTSPVVDLLKTITTTTSPETKTLILSYHRDDADTEFLNTLARAISDLGVTVDGFDDIVIVYVLSCGEVSQGGNVLTFGVSKLDKKIVADVVGVVWKAFGEGFKRLGNGDGVKGGGRDGRFQGKVAGGGVWKGRGEVVKGLGGVEVVV